MRPHMRTAKRSFSNRQEIRDNTDRIVTDMKMKSKRLRAIIKYRGVNNIRFYASINTLNAEIPIDSSENTIGKKEVVECRIDESVYKIKDWYKITLTPAEESGKYGYEHYYITDFVSLINEGLITIKDD